MSEQTIDLKISPELYEHLRQRAEAGGRTVQDEIVQRLHSTTADASVLPPYVTEAISPLPFYSDAELWQAARSRVSAEDSDRIEELHRKRGRVGLSDTEVRELAGLMRFCDRIMLVRAEAAVLLKQRGHDISVLLNES